MPIELAQNWAVHANRRAVTDRSVEGRIWLLYVAYDPVKIRSSGQCNPGERCAVD